MNESSESAATKNVLIIDDDPLFCALVVGLLEIQGYQGIIAPDGAQALQLIKEDGRKIDAVLVDYTMRPMNGRQILAQIKIISPSLPVVMMSGSAKEDLPAAAEQAAFPGFLQKPFSSEALKRAIELASRAGAAR